jgi:hypothetical protein
MVHGGRRRLCLSVRRRLFLSVRQRLCPRLCASVCGCVRLGWRQCRRSKEQGARPRVTPTRYYIVANGLPSLLPCWPPTPSSVPAPAPTPLSASLAVNTSVGCTRPCRAGLAVLAPWPAAAYKARSVHVPDCAGRAAGISAGCSCRGPVISPHAQHGRYSSLTPNPFFKRRHGPKRHRHRRPRRRRRFRRPGLPSHAHAGPGRLALAVTSTAMSPGGNSTRAPASYICLVPASPSSLPDHVLRPLAFPNSFLT